VVYSGLSCFSLPDAKHSSHRMHQGWTSQPAVSSLVLLRNGVRTCSAQHHAQLAAPFQKQARAQEYVCFLNCKFAGHTCWHFFRSCHATCKAMQKVSSTRCFATTFRTVNVCKVLSANATKQDGSKFEGPKHVITPLYVM